MRWLWPLLLLMLGCDAAGILETASAYHPELDSAALAEKAREMGRVMPFYVTGACLALLMMLLATLNGLEHARSLGRSEGLRYGAYLLLLGFVSLFVAMNAERDWLPIGHPLVAFLGAAAFSAIGTALVARLRPERSVMAVGYLSATAMLPLLALLLSTPVYLVDTTASVFIGYASGLLLVIIFSTPVRAGLVDFLRRGD